MTDPSSTERLQVVLLTPSHASAARVEVALRTLTVQLDAAMDADEASPMIRSHGCDALIADLDELREQEVEFVREVREIAPWLPILLFGADAEARAAVKPGPGIVVLRDVGALGPRLVEEVQMHREARRNARLLRCVEDARRIGVPLGNSEAWCEAKRGVEAAIESRSPILLIGEPSTGRRTLARYIHDTAKAQRGETGGAGFLEVDAALDADLLADTETIYFPELLRLGGECIQELRKLADRDDGPRLVLATTRAEQFLRRSSVARFLETHTPVMVELPPLRERRDDIAMLATAFLEEAADRIPHQGFSLRALTLLQLWHWPGNIRELARVVNTAWDLAGGRQIGRRHLIGPGARLPASLELRAQSLGSRVDSIVVTKKSDIMPFEVEERRILAHALAAMGGNVTKAAEALEIGRATLYRKIRHFGLRPGRD